MRIAPDTTMLNGLRRQNLDWRTVVKELVDNSIDAGARSIRVAWPSNDSFEIEDDGDGADEEGLRALLVIGRHYSHKKRGSIGRYGVGAKDVLGWQWGRLSIRTVHRGIKRQVRLDWGAVLDSGVWEVADPKTTAAPNQPSGMWIKVTNSERRAPSLETVQRIADDLSFTYYPALRAGIKMRLVLKDHAFEVRPFEPPPALRDLRVSGTVRVGRKQAAISAWVVPPEARNPRFGLSYIYRQRVILPSSNLGCGDYNPSRLFGWVELLSDDWQVTRHKDAIDEVDRDALAEAVYAVAAPLLKQAADMAEHIQLRDIELELSRAIRGQIKRLKEKRRSPENNTGTVQPVGTERTRKRARQKHQTPGNIEDQIPDTSALKVQFVGLGEDAGLGEYRPATKTVFLNNDDPNIREWRNDYRGGGRDRLIDHAFVLLCYELDRQNAVGELFLKGFNNSETPFSVALSRLLSARVPDSGLREEAA